MAGLDLAGAVTGGLADLYGSNKASNIERRATRKAGRLLDEGYGAALNLARPMQERSQADYEALSGRYGAGAFKPESFKEYGDFSFDPQSVFDDPEYQAQMRAGREALEGGAASKGTLFSGRTAQDLSKLGSDIFAGRSDELYRRGRGEFESDRDYSERGQEFNRENLARDFEMGSQLASYAPGALDRSIDLGLGRSQAQADTELGVGQIRGNAYRSGGRKIGRMAQQGLSQLGGMNTEGSLY